MKHWCSYCDRSYRIGEKSDYAKYYCENGTRVNRHGTCDRWIHKIQDHEFYQRVRESLKRMEPYQEGTYEIRKRPPVGTNYRIIE